MRRFIRALFWDALGATARTRLGLEALEERHVPTVTLEIDTLRINGTSGSDWYTVNDSQYGLQVMTIQYGMLYVDLFDYSAVSRVVFYGGGGNDELDCRTIARPVTAYGGSGDDTLFGGQRENLLLGEEGNDWLNCKETRATIINDDMDLTVDGHQSRGRTYADGGSGNDHIRGSRWKDTVIGADGNDVLVGSQGDDIITGGSGNDFLYGGDDQDTLNGGLGVDAVIGGLGLDYLDGGPDLDWDVLIGGLSTNTVDPNGGDTFVKYVYTGMTPAPGQWDEYRDRSPDDVVVTQYLYIPWTQPTSAYVPPSEIGSEPFDYTISGNDRLYWSG